MLLSDDVMDVHGCDRPPLVGGLKRQPPAATLALAIVSDADIKMGDNSFP